MTDVDDAKHGPSCLPGTTAPNAHGGSVYEDGPDKKFTGHWVVKPGREVNHTNVTKYLNMPYDTTLHYVAVHLHPFAESLELYDLTAKKTIFKSKARGFKDKIGLAYVDTYSSRSGVPLFKDHEYDIISTYNNTTSSDKDSMAVMLLFALDKNFKKPAVTLAPVAPLGGNVVLKTTLGDLVVALDPKAAPATVAHFMELVRAGAYDATRVLTILPGFIVQFASVSDRPTPLSDSQRALVHQVPLEAKGMKHQRGVLSMAREPNDPNSGESSFCIVLGDAPHLDGQYTVFGKVEKGMDVLEAIERTPRDDKNQPLTPVLLTKAVVLDNVSSPMITAPTPKTGNEKLRLKTSLGEMTFVLYPQVAPQTVEQILRLVRAGAYDSIRIFRVEPGFVAQLTTVQDRQTPLTSEQQALIHKIPAEFSAMHHHRGILSMARQDNDINSGESSFSILLGDAPHLDGKYTVFGELESGADVLSAIEKAPRNGNAPVTRIDILKADVVGEDPLVTPTDKPVVSEQGTAPDGEHYKILVFKGLEIDKLYPSMRGPWTRAYLTLEPDSPRLWITGYRAEVLDGKSGRASQEFMCHTKLDQVASPQASSAQGMQSFFVISQGQDEIRFPKGFGLRVENNAEHRYDLNVMVLNNNYPTIKRKLDFKATIDYLKDAEAKEKGYIPLTLISASVYCTGCREASPGQMQGPNGSTGHWYVPPGRHSYRQTISLGLAKDTTVHYIMAHLHPHAESVELRDLTTNESVWKGHMSNDPDPAKSLLLKTEHYTSSKGKPLYKDHQYEVIATYNNPTPQDIDAMASFWIYVRADPA